MADRKTENQAMPHDGRKGAPDGVNSQADKHATGGSDDGAPYPNPHTITGQAGTKHRLADGMMSHGGQSDMAYHGTGQLGAKKTKPGGNRNSGSREE